MATQLVGGGIRILPSEPLHYIKQETGMLGAR